MKVYFRLDVQFATYNESAGEYGPLFPSKFYIVQETKNPKTARFFRAAAKKAYAAADRIAAKQGTEWHKLDWTECDRAEAIAHWSEEVLSDIRERGMVLAG